MTIASVDCMSAHDPTRRKALRATVALVASLSVSVLVGCATQAQPKDLSVLSNEEAAEREQRAASASDPCHAGRTDLTAPCWTVQGQARADVEEHERLAAEHRHAAELRAAEQRSCAGVSKADRIQSPFSHNLDILSVQPLVVKQSDGSTRAAGAVVLFRKVPGLTAERLDQIIQCQLARNAALGMDRPDLKYCPLTVNPLGFKQIQASVADRPDGLAVTLEANDARVAQQILQRAERAAGPARCLAAPVETET